MPPPEYSFNIPRPSEQLLAGIQTGQGISNIISQREQALASQTRQRAITDAMSELNAIEQPTAANYTKVASMLPKEQADSLRANWGLLSKENQTNKLRSAGHALAALSASPNVGIKLLREQAVAQENSGDTQGAEATTRWADIAEINPDFAVKNMSIMVAAIPGGSKILDSISKAQVAGKGVDGIDPVQSSKILDDGTVQIVRKSGAIEVKSLAESTKDLVKGAQRFGAELQGLRAGERDAAKAAIKQSVEAFKKLAPVKKNIKNLTEGMRLIDEGAQTGVIAKRFPSIKTASQELENLQGRLGLDIIADVTFGALSESELAFAKDTALPIGLEGEPLKAWLSRKRDAQKVLVESLEEAALFLGEPGNTVPDYIRMKRTREQPAAQPTTQPAAAAALPQGVTEEDIAETMRIHSVTREQVLDRIGGR
ncbi:hypothetical protein KAR91_01925 [Candidatus Pacearchaeota archaeon]|nr:hypothetical protein [Candidatus Pacearchaeota archaeon]